MHALKHDDVVNLLTLEVLPLRGIGERLAVLGHDADTWDRGHAVRVGDVFGRVLIVRRYDRIMFVVAGFAAAKNASVDGAV